ncbi:MAG: hypothetical protein LBH03_01615 [Holophagales bacterium]|jgi:hypothetical protein|nr:hypothetical protein [Holophagales bacterium]
MSDNETNLEATGKANAESDDKLNSELGDGLNSESGDELQDEGFKWLPRKIIFGSLIVCFGIAIMLYDFDFFHFKDVLWFLPFALVVTGLLRIWKKGFFNIMAQILVIGGLQIHLALLGYKNVIELGLPILIIWIGILVIVKGFLPGEGPPKYRGLSAFKTKLQQGQQIDGNTSSVTAEPENKEQIQ